MQRLLLNLFGFQVAWWSCVLSARMEAAWIGMAVTAGVFALHLAVSPFRSAEVWFVPLAAVLGYAVDTLATLLGALQFDGGSDGAWPTPLWIAALWLAFATTLNTTFVWLRKSMVVAALVGAASGPLSYAAGAALGAVTLPEPSTSVLVLSLLWGATLPTLVSIARRAVRPGAWRAGLPAPAGELT